MAQQRGLSSAAEVVVLLSLCKSVLQRKLGQGWLEEGPLHSQITPLLLLDKHVDVGWYGQHQIPCPYQSVYGKTVFGGQHTGNLSSGLVGAGMVGQFGRFIHCLLLCHTPLWRFLLLLIHNT